MAQSSKTMLDSGDTFPDLTLDLSDGSRLELPEEVKGSWTIFLVYRGHW